MNSSLIRVVRKLVAASCILAGLGLPARAQDGHPPHLTLLGVPSALTLPAGSGFAQATYSSDRHGSGLGSDGSTAFGLGFGDLRQGFGAHVIGELTSYHDFGADGYLTFQGATRIRRAAVPTFVGLSVDRLIAWGDGAKEDPAISLMVTSFPQSGALPIMVTGGVRVQRIAAGGGAGGFGGSGGETDDCDPEFDDCYVPTARAAPSSGLAVTAGDYEVGLFGGVGVGLSDQWAAGVSWNVDHAILGASFRPRAARNMNVSLSLVDPFEQVGNAHVALSISYLFGNKF